MDIDSVGIQNIFLRILWIWVSTPIVQNLVLKNLFEHKLLCTFMVRRIINLAIYTWNIYERKNDLTNIYISFMIFLNLSLNEILLLPFFACVFGGIENSWWYEPPVFSTLLNMVWSITSQSRHYGRFAIIKKVYATRHHNIYKNHLCDGLLKRWNA